MSLPLVIDADGHIREPADIWQRFLPKDLIDRAPDLGSGNPFLTIDGVVVPPHKNYAKHEKSVFANTVETRYEGAKSQGFSARSQLDGMDVEGISASVLFPSAGLLIMGVDGVDPKLTTAMSRAYNSWLADFASEDPTRLLGAAMIDPRDISGAVAEAQRAVEELGFVAVFLRPNPVNGLAWHDLAYEPLWSALEELGVPVCFHEGAAVPLPQIGTDRFAVHSFWHCITHPVENQMAMLSMVLGGVAARHPNLRMAFLECGAGWLPYWMWRLDEHAENEPGDFPYLTMEPSEYIQRQCFVSIDSDEEPGMSAIKVLEGPHVVWGSDYPHADGKFPNAFKTLSSLPDMTEERLRGVVYDAPLALFGERLRTKLGS